MKKFNTLWELSKCERDTKWVNGVGKMTCSTQGCHKPLIWKNTIYAKCIKIECNKIRYAYLYQNNLQIFFMGFQWLELTGNSGNYIIKAEA